VRTSGWRAGCLAGGALLLAGACGKAESVDDAGGLLWETPELPGPVTVEVNGRAVDPVLIHGFLLPLWTEHGAQQAAAGAQPTAESFFTAPQELFTPLVRGIVLLQEAEARWPDLPAAEVDHLQAEMAANTGEVLAALERRIGAAGVRAHVERELRKRLILEAFGAEAPEVTEDQVFARYEEMMAEVEDPALLLQMGINFSTLAPQIRADLERSAAVAAQEAWIDLQMPAARVQVGLPGRGIVRW